MSKINISLVLIIAILFAINFVYAETGVTETEILIGQACALTGPAQGLGKAMQAGANAYFAYINSQGGVHGRMIKLITVDDGYEPDRCIQATNDLINNNKVFMLFGYVGTPTSKAVLPITKQNNIPYFAPFTGAEFLRNPVSSNIYNIRGSYFQETEAQVAQLADVLGKKNIAVFYQNDGYGKAGLGGVQKATIKRGMQISAMGTYERNTVDIQAGLDAIKPAKPDAVIMIGAYAPCAAFIKAAKSQGLNAIFLNVSFVGSIPLLKELGNASDNVVVTQVVPLPYDTSVPLVAEYQENMKKFSSSSEFGFGSLEGYLDAKVLVEGLKRTGKGLTRAGLQNALDGMSNVDFGGVTIGFSSSDHQGLDTVHFTTIKNGKYIEIKSLKEL